MTAATVDGGSSSGPRGDERTPKAVAFFDRIDAYNNLLLPVLAIVSALVAGAVIIGLTDIDRLKEGDILGILGTIKDAYLALPAGALGSLNGISETIVSATPLILAGLCFAIAARSGLFNIGATGQMFAGGMASVWVGFSMNGPGIVQVPLALLAGIVAGGIWGGIVGFLKARTGAHEVITTIMTNYIAGLLTLWLLKTDAFQQPGKDNPISKTVRPEGRLPDLFFWSDNPALRAHWGFLVAIAGAMFTWWLFERSKIGFELRTFGSNADAARYAGMKPATLTTMAMFIAGAMAGLAGASQVIGTQGYATESFAGSIGFDAIAVALLGRNKPTGIVFAAFLFGILEAGGRRMQLETDIPLDVVLVLRALIVLFIAAPALTRLLWRLKREGGGSALQFRGWGA
ncbi:MAG: ABC transporter permease [Acidimicrobiales bacterium]|nr:ABC transporter permease [Acidimicrobiales bacterium]MCB9393190.1 ABC transporter permease [Acidimicrobiaceae bacterium]